MDADILDVLVFDKWEIDYLYKLVMQDYLSSDAGKMEDDRNQKVRLKLQLQKEKYPELKEYFELTKKVLKS